MNVLRAANKAHARHTEAVSIERFFRRGDERRVVCQAKVIVGAHVEDTLPVADRNLCVLRGGDNPFGLIEALSMDFLESPGELLIKGRKHVATCAFEWAMQKPPQNILAANCE